MVQLMRIVCNMRKDKNCTYSIYQFFLHQEDILSRMLWLHYTLMSIRFKDELSDPDSDAGVGDLKVTLKQAPEPQVIMQ